MRCEQCGAESEGGLCPKCLAQLTELPIPASFFTPEEAANRRSYAPPAQDSAGAGFVITAASLEIEAVSPESEPEPSPNPPADPPKPRVQTQTAPREPSPRPAAPITRTEAQKPAGEPPRAVSSEPIPVAEGFYLVPYDESMWATLSRIRHRWMLPIIVGVIFVAGMTTGIVMAHSAAKNKDQPEDSAADSAAESETDAELPPADDALLAYFEKELLPQYGYAPNGIAVEPAQANGVLSLFAAGQQMTVLRLEDGALHTTVYLHENGKVQQQSDTVYDALLDDIAALRDAVLIGDANGIYLGSTRICETGLGTPAHSAPVTLCACRTDDAAAYSFTDYTGIRTNIPDSAVGWQSLYTALLAETLQALPEEDTASYRLLKIDGDDTPELELRTVHGGVTSSKLFTVYEGTLRELTGEADASEYVCAPQENCYRESVKTADGTYYYWYHLADGAAVRDHTLWFGMREGEWAYSVDGAELSADEFLASMPEAESRLETDIAYFDLREEE